MVIAGRSWYETFGEFSAWLEQAGLTPESLPAWAATRPVRVMATAWQRLYLEPVSRREMQAFNRKADRGEEWIRPVTREQLGQMYEVRVVDVNVKKLKAWQVNNDRCN